MKSSIVIICLLLVNTTALISEPLSVLISNTNVWVLLAIEVLLICAYYINWVFKDINRVVFPDFNVKFFKKKN